MLSKLIETLGAMYCEWFDWKYSDFKLISFNEDIYILSSHSDMNGKLRQAWLSNIPSGGMQQTLCRIAFPFEDRYIKRHAE